MSRTTSRTNTNSRTTSRTNVNVNNVNTYCKVCHDAGKMETEYRSHSIRDRNSNLICPTLLSLECRFCYKNGHTIKYCPSNKSRDRYERKVESRDKYKNDQKTKEQNSSSNLSKLSRQSNKFAYLCYDSDDDKQNKDKKQKKNKKEDFPQISVTIVKNNTNSQIPMSYTSIISKTQEQVLDAEKAHRNKIYQAKVDADQRRKELEEREKQRKVESITIPISIPRKKTVFSQISWADAESSDDDDCMNDYINKNRIASSKSNYDSEDEDW